MRWRRRAHTDPNELLVRTAEKLWREAEERGLPEEEFAEAVNDGLKSSVPGFVDELVHRTPAMLRSRRRTERGSSDV